MIKIKIDKNKLGEPIFKLGYKDLSEKETIFLKRALIEGKEIKGMYKYQVPLRYLYPIVNNFSKESTKVDKYSKNSFFEFSDGYDEKYYYAFEITPKYMRKWREEECPNIFKVQLNADTLEISKEIVFKKIKRAY